MAILYLATAADDGSFERATGTSPPLTEYLDANSSDEWVRSSSQSSEIEASRGVGSYRKKTPSTKAAKMRATFSRLPANMTSVPTTSATADEEKITAAEAFALGLKSSPPTPTITETAPSIEAALATTSIPRLPMKFTIGVRPKNTRKIVAMTLLTTATPLPVNDAKAQTTTTTANSADGPVTTAAAAIRLPPKFAFGGRPKDAKKIVAVSLLTTAAAPVTEISTTEPTTASYEDIISSVTFEPLKILDNIPHEMPTTTTATSSTSTPLPIITKEKTQDTPATFTLVTMTTETTATDASTTTTGQFTSTTTPLPYVMKRITQYQPSTPPPTTTTTATTSRLPYTMKMTSQPQPPTTTRPITTRPITTRPITTTSAPTTTIRPTTTPLAYTTQRTTEATTTTTTTTMTTTTTTTTIEEAQPLADDLIAIESNEIIVPAASASVAVAGQQRTSVPPAVLPIAPVNQQRIAPVWLFKPLPARETLIYNYPGTIQLPAVQQLQRASMQHFSLVSRIPLLYNRPPYLHYSSNFFRSG